MCIRASVRSSWCRFHCPRGWARGQGAKHGAGGGGGSAAPRRRVQPSLLGSVLRPPPPSDPVVSSCPGPWCVSPGRRPGLCQGNTGKRDRKYWDRKSPAPPGSPGPYLLGLWLTDKSGVHHGPPLVPSPAHPFPQARVTLACRCVRGGRGNVQLHASPGGPSALPGQEGLVQAAGQTLLLPPAPPTLAPEAQPRPRLVWPQGAGAHLLPLRRPHPW